MWHCTQCDETVDDSYFRCWNCGTDKKGVVDPEFMHADLMSVHDTSEPETSSQEWEEITPQFSLRTLLISITCLCVIFAVLEGPVADVFLVMLFMMLGAVVGLHASTLFLGLLSSWLRRRH